MQLLWSEPAGLWLLSDADGVIHGWSYAESAQPAQIFDAARAIISTSPGMPLLGLVSATENGPSLVIKNLDSGNEALAALELEIPNASMPEWQRGAPIIAFGSGYDAGHSDQITVLNLEEGVDSGKMFRLRHTLSYILGWSSDGRVLAVAQETSNGLRPVYLYVEDEKSRDSEFSQYEGNCVEDPAMSPIANSLLFSGTNYDAANFDLYLEEFGENHKATPILRNMTNTPDIDELMAAWSPAGDQIAFVRVMAGPDRVPVQNIYLLSDLANGPNLTELTSYSTGNRTAYPIWLSAEEVAYLNWTVAERLWSLEYINLATGARRTLAMIPAEWLERKRQ